MSPVVPNGSGVQAAEHCSLLLNESVDGPAEFTPTSGTQSQHQKKKKKKKSKKLTKPKDVPNAPTETNEERPPVLCISRNKHWRYISSYHGPWLQLPSELLESLLTLNLDPNTLTGAETRVSPTSSLFKDTPHISRNRGYSSVSDHSSPNSPHSMVASLPSPPPLPIPKPGKATPPPIDPGVFRSVTRIRRLIDEASELSVRASSGLSAAALGSLRGGSGFGRDSWNAAHILGYNGLSDGSAGRQIPMSATRIHKLRVLAVQKLAAAYKADEIASSVMVMQGGSVFDDIADRVLKVDPNDVDARYVQFFHEKIPSRQLSESTTTQQLDQLIILQPHRLEFYRTRGIVHCFRDEFPLAVKDFTHVLREARAVRKTRGLHLTDRSLGDQHGKTTIKKRKGKCGGAKTNGQAPPDGTSNPSITDRPTIDGPNGEPLLIHPSALCDAPDPIEPQCVFLRGAAYLQHATYLIEEAILKLEGVRQESSPDGADLRLSYLENGRYGGVEIDNLDGPLGSRHGAKLQAYRLALADVAFRGHITTLVKRALRDHERFLSYFDTLEDHDQVPERNLFEKAGLAFRICENARSNGQRSPPPFPNLPPMFTTYHPLLVESHFSVLLCKLILGEFTSLIPAFYRTARLVDGLEGYPIFLPPRSMSQAEFIEILERLAGGWRNGIKRHSLSSVSDELALVAKSSNGKGVDRSMLSPIAVSAASSTSDLTSDTATSESSLSATTLTPMTASTSSYIFDESASSDIYRSSTPDDDVLPSPSKFENSPNVGDITLADSATCELVESLDCARILLNAVVARRREKKIEKSTIDNANGRKKPMSLIIPLHGPRVEIVLAWLGAVHLYELDSVA